MLEAIAEQLDDSLVIVDDQNAVHAPPLRPRSQWSRRV